MGPGVAPRVAAGVAPGVRKIVTVGTGVGIGFGGTNASRGSVMGGLTTMETIPTLCRCVKNWTSANCETDPAEFGTEVTVPTGTPGTKGFPALTTSCEKNISSFHG